MASSGGTIDATATGLSVETRTDFAWGAYATGTDVTGTIPSKIVLGPATITTHGTTGGDTPIPHGGAAYGVFAQNGALINLTGTIVTNPGTNLPDGSASYFADGLHTEFNGTITGSDVTINSNSLNASGAFSNFSGHIILKDSTITTGVASGIIPPNEIITPGVRVQNNGAVELTNTTITTSGLHGFGLLAEEGGGTITAIGGSVSTSGVGAIGVWANRSNASISLTRTPVTTSGPDSHGVAASGTGLTPGGGVVTLSGDIIKTSGPRAHGMFAQFSGQITSTGGSVSTTNDNAVGVFATGSGSRITLSGTPITTSGTFADGLHADTAALIEANNVTIDTSGKNAIGALAIGATINLTSSKITTQAGDGIRITNGGTMNLTRTDITAGLNGVSFGTLPTNTPLNGTNTLTINGPAVITAKGGDAIFVDAAVADITINNISNTITSSTGNLLNVVSDATVNFIANSSTLTGNILVDATSSANVMLKNNSVLTGAINQNHLSGANNVASAEGFASAGQITGLPHTVNLLVDPSTWNMTASSTLAQLQVVPGALINFVRPNGGPFKTLVANSLIGSGGIFGMNVDLPNFRGDLLVIQTPTAGFKEHRLQITNLNQGQDPAPNRGLLVVMSSQTSGLEFPSNQVDAGTFKYFSERGDGSPAAPDPHHWYLVRADELPSPPHAGPTPPGPTPPTPDEPTPLTPTADLTNTANAAIGTYSSTIPLFYADMQTLVERMGELRLGIETAPAPVPPSPPEVGKGVVESKQVVPPPAPPPKSEWGVWIRGFGNGMRINNDVSRTFYQNVGGFQIGADRRFGSLWSGDVYLGVFGSYFYASRDFRDGGDGSSNAFSLGGYATWIHPQGWYADMVVKYTQLWNYFSTPTLAEIVSRSTGYYNIPTVGGSLEVGKRFDFADHCFFIEPQAQLAGVWENGMDYTASNGLHVHGDDQTSLQGRLGGRIGLHFDLSQGRAIEPYAKAEVIEEFLTGNTVRTDTTNFNSSLSGTVGRFGGGFAAKLSQSIYIYGEYDYATGDHIQAPWSVSAGLRWQW